MSTHHVSRHCGKRVVAASSENDKTTPKRKIIAPADRNHRRKMIAAVQIMALGISNKKIKDIALMIMFYFLHNVSVEAEPRLAGR